MILRWLAGLLAGAVLCGLLTALWLLGTQPGTAWLVRQAAGFAPGDLAVTHLRGSVLAGVSAEELAWTLEDTRIALHGLRIDWRPALLVGGRIAIGQLSASSFSVVVPPDDDTADTPFAMPEIVAPLPVSIERLQLDELRLQVGDLDETIGDIVAAASLEGSHLEVRELHGAVRGLALRIAGSAELTPQLPLSAQVAWRVGDPALGGEGTVEGDLAALVLRQTITAAEGAPFAGSIEVAGTLHDPANALRAELGATWQSLSVPIEDVGPLTASAGQLRLEGRPDEWRAVLETRLRAAPWPELAATVAFDGDLEMVQIRELRLAGTPGLLVANGTLDVTAQPRLRLEIAASEINPEVLRAGLRGRLASEISLDATLPDDIGIELRALRGTFMGRAVAGSGSVGYASGRMSIRDLQLSAGRNALQAAGTLGERLAGRFSLQAPELGVLWPELSGSLAGHGTVAGTAARPQGAVELSGTELALETTRVGSLAFSAAVDGAGRLEARLQAGNLVSGENRLGDLLATATGDLRDHGLDLRLTGGALELEAQSRGSWDGRALRHQITPATARAQPVGEWRLLDVLAVQWQESGTTIGDHCWGQGAASLCLRHGAWSGARGSLAAELRGLSLESYGALLGEDMALAGTVAADLDVQQDAGGITGRLAWRQEGTTFYYTGGEEPIVLAFPTVRLDVTATAELARLQAEVQGQAGIGLQAAGTLARQPDGGGELAGELRGELPDIAEIVTLLTPDWDLAEVAGRLSLDARVSGTAVAPRVTGALVLRDGAFTLPDTGVRIEEMQITATGDDTATLVIAGTARSGGLLQLDGEFALLAEPGPSGFIRVRGDKVEVLRLPERYVQTSPDVTLRYEAGRLVVDGVVNVPKADIVVRQLPATATLPSTDTVVRDRPAAATEVAGGPRIEGAMQINFGKDVRLKAFGLDTRLTGGLRLSQTPEGAAAGEGVVRLAEGKFGAYGQELTIDRGALIFNGPLDDPTFDARASRRVDYEGRTVTAGLLLSGTPKRPQSRVFSEPAMGEADALSYLVSGKPLSSANSEDRSAIGGAALALGLQQASPITRQIGSAVALDELGVEGGELDETQVVAGKQLNPDLYLRFAYGLFNRIGTVLARYRIGRGLSIEAASGEDQSLDLIWSAEKD